MIIVSVNCIRLEVYFVKRLDLGLDLVLLLIYVSLLSVSIMCRLVATEDDSTSELEHLQSTVNELDHMDPEIRAQIARLEARISRVEARMEKIEQQLAVSSFTGPSTPLLGLKHSV
ncbi:hypothetical protein Tco_1246825 [Tanacetum coccineum]